MGRPRSQLHDLLKELLDSDNVYFQPPATKQMEYPCIRYELAPADTRFAGNSPYTYTKRYKVTVIAKDQDSDIPDKIAQLPMCLHNRYYAANNLNHNVFNLYF